MLIDAIVSVHTKYCKGYRLTGDPVEGKAREFCALGGIWGAVETSRDPKNHPGELGDG